MAQAIQKYLTAPRTPNTAAGFIDDNFTVVDLRRGRRGFSLAASAVTQLPAGLVTPSFDAQNIHDADELAEIILHTSEAAGLASKKRWSIALPEGVARTFVITLESKPTSRRELNEIISWKIERVIAAAVSELRVSRQRISPVAGQERYLVTAAREEAISQYESIFWSIKWQAGLLLPRHLGEAQWLMWDKSPGDKMLVSGNRTGFTSVIIQNGEPALVRNYVCEPAARMDELHRFALYYRDRLGEGLSEAINLSQLLVIGGLDVAEAQNAVSDALEAQPRALDPAGMGFDLANEPIRFDQIAGAAGLASIAWR